MIYVPRFFGEEIQSHFTAGVRTYVDPCDVANLDDEQLTEKELAAKRLHLRRMDLIKMHHDMEMQERNRIFELDRLRIETESLKKHAQSEYGISIKDPSPGIFRFPFLGTTEQRMAEDKRIFLENKAKEEEIKSEKLADEALERFKVDWYKQQYTESFWDSVKEIPIFIFELIKYEINNYIISVKERYDL